MFWFRLSLKIVKSTVRITKEPYFLDLRFVLQDQNFMQAYLTLKINFGMVDSIFSIKIVFIAIPIYHSMKLRVCYNIGL